MEFNTYEDAFVGILEHLMTYGQDVEVRGMKTKEILHANITIHYPDRRLNLVKHRNGNPFAQIAETLWMLQGNDDLDWLETYIPQCKKWSDDGQVWRAAYGPRLRAWEGVSDYCNQDDPHPHMYKQTITNTDQVQKVIDLLWLDPNSRQAVISIWNPAEDWVKSMDIPCNNWLHFLIREGSLHLNVAVRSNDVMYGFSHNDFYGWSVLQSLVADILGVGVGRMTWNASSLHLYEKHYRRAMDILHAHIPYASIHLPYGTPGFDDVTNIRVFDKITRAIMTVLNMREQLDIFYREPITDYNSQSYMDVAGHMLRMYRYYLFMDKRTNSSLIERPIERVAWVNQLAAHISAMPMIDAKYSAIEFFCRKIPGFGGALELSPNEHSILKHYAIV